MANDNPKLRTMQVKVTRKQYMYLTEYATIHNVSVSGAVRDIIDFHKKYNDKMEIQRYEDKNK